MKINLFKFCNFNQIEEEYYLHFLDHWIKQFIIAVSVSVICAALLSLNDFVFFHHGSKLVVTIFYRICFIIISAAAIISVWKKRDIRVYNYATLAWLLCSCVLSIYITANRPGCYVFGFVWDILIVFVIYLMVPATMTIQLFIAFCYSIGIASLWYIVKLPYLEVAAAYSLGLALVMTNLIGSIFSWQLKSSARKQFFLYKEDQQIKEKLREQNETKNKFFSIISHDLRNPLSNIISICNMAQSGSDISPGKLIAMINQGAESAHSLLENLLAWAMAESGQLVPSPSKINVAELFSEKMLFFEQDASSRNISIQCADMSELKAYADYNMLQTVLRNLLSNAIKFTPDGGTIKIYAAKKNGMLEISVQDSGVGIDEEVLPRLFDIDFHHSTVGVNNEQGSGLGLKLCREFIVKNGGDLWVESKKNQGSTFTFSIPQADAKAQ